MQPYTHTYAREKEEEAWNRMRIDEGIQAKQIYSTIRGKGKKKEAEIFWEKIIKTKKEDKEVDFYVFYFFFFLGRCEIWNTNEHQKTKKQKKVK